MNNKLKELLESLCSVANEEIMNKIDDYLHSVECAIEVTGIKNHYGNWVHPIVGVVDGIDECEVASDVVCKLLEAKHGALEAFKMLDDLKIEYEFGIDNNGSHRFALRPKSASPKCDPVIWTSGVVFNAGETVWSRLIDFLYESKENKKSWVYKFVDSEVLKHPLYIKLVHSGWNEDMSYDAVKSYMKTEDPLLASVDGNDADYHVIEMYHDISKFMKCCTSLGE